VVRRLFELVRWAGEQPGRLGVGKKRRRSVEIDLEDLVKLERMGSKSALNVVKRIEMSLQQPLNRLINGLGIPFVGERTAQILAETFGDLDKIMNGPEEELKKAEEVGPKIAHGIRQF
jgi:DNA ligase (NAD+)